MKPPLHASTLEAYARADPEMRLRMENVIRAFVGLMPIAADGLPKAGVAAVSPTCRKALAARVGVNEQYLYQCLAGIRGMRPKQAVRVERDSGMVLRRWDLRPVDWHLIWPELIGAEGAPPAPPREVANQQSAPGAETITAEPAARAI
jgi:DNA-binding transcriptional regulator YdaS (Cro superfamily)